MNPIRTLLCSSFIGLAAAAPAVAAQSAPAGLDWQPIVSLPAVIDSPGGYYLAQNATVANGVAAIFVDANNVLLDLDGFTLTGQNTVFGVLVNDGLSRTRIVNGTLEGFGVGVAAERAEEGTLERLRIRGGSIGAELGIGFEVQDCRFESNAREGLVAGEGCIVQRCTAAANGDSGFELGPGSLIGGSQSTENGGAGIALTEGSALVDSCEVSHNAAGGVSARTNSKVRACVVTENEPFGIRAEGACDLRENLLGANVGTGSSAAIVVAGAGSLVEENQLVGNFGNGLLVQGTNNAVVANFSSGTLVDYSVAPGNLFGPVIGAAQVPANANPHVNYE